MVLFFCILRRQNTKKIMGKGDKKSRRGKINSGTFGVRRPRIKKRVRPETKISVDKKTKVKP